MILIDTSAWIRLFGRRPHPEVETRVTTLMRSGQAAINPMVLLELIFGTRDRAGMETVQEYLRGVTNLAIAGQTWDITGELGFSLRRAGLVTAIPDLTIAASAIEHGATLLHADADFDRIAESSDLQVESYVAA